MSKEPISFQKQQYVEFRMKNILRQVFLYLRLIGKKLIPSDYETFTIESWKATSTLVQMETQYGY